MSPSDLSSGQSLTSCVALGCVSQLTSGEATGVESGDLRPLPASASDESHRCRAWGVSLRSVEIQVLLGSLPYRFMENSEVVVRRLTLD